MSVAPNVLLRGAWYALEQCGHLLQNAVALHGGRAYASAVALALLAREELGRYRILLDLWRQVAGGRAASVEDVRAACDDHVTKQREAQLSIVYRAEGAGGFPGNYLQLSDLIMKALAEPSFPLSRNTKRALPGLRDLGHMSAHGRYFTAQKADVDAVQPGCRVVVDEFLHHAKLL